MTTFSPKTAITLEDILSLESDNFSTKEASIILNEGVITIFQQRSGEPAKGCVMLKKADFDKLIEWYAAETSYKDKAP